MLNHKNIKFSVKSNKNANLRRGRKNSRVISSGDSLDFWRVLYADREEKRLLLYAEMKLPGKAWLEWKTEDETLVQTTTFRPLAVALMAVFFNFVIAGFLRYYTGTLHTHYNGEWLTDPRFIAGLLIFFTGMVINITSDEKLIHLRKDRSNGYRIPRGGLFERVICPNFMGETVEWGVYAILCWSLPAFSFFVRTFSNQVPRALSHHRWYKNHFPDYPTERKAVFPYIL